MAPLHRAKILLMGASQSGKTSMRSLVFGGAARSECCCLGVTIDVEQSNYCISCGTFLHIWDCGGQDVFVREYFSTSTCNHHSQRLMFSQLKCAVFVFDVSSGDFEGEVAYFVGMIRKVREYSHDARIFCLLHKMDLIPEGVREAFVRERIQRIKAYLKSANASGNEESMFSGAGGVAFFSTSIWDESLMEAWSAIVSGLIPNAKELESWISGLVHEWWPICQVQQIMLFDKSSMLLLSSTEIQEQEGKDGIEGEDSYKNVRLNSICKRQLSAIISQARKTDICGAEFKRIRWRCSLHEWNLGVGEEFVWVFRMSRGKEKEVSRLISQLERGFNAQ